MKTHLLPEVFKKIESIQSLSIAIERRNLLDNIVHQLQVLLDKHNALNLNFICTHNSRRSQLCQIWSSVLAKYYNLEKIICFSGGTEITAFHPNAINAVRRAGIKVTSLDADSNPNYHVQFSLEQENNLICSSKLYNDASMEGKSFVAIMTCSDAEDNCPFIPDAIARIPLKYKDPKYADNTAEVEIAYDLCSDTIASELNYIFNKLKN
jgi:arsenate reductase